MLFRVGTHRSQAAHLAVSFDKAISEVEVFSSWAYEGSGRSAMRKLFLRLSSSILPLLPALTLAYGPLGHQLVGEIADERLKGTPAGNQVSALIDGFSLEKVAVIPDEIKGWDKKGADAPGIFHYSAHPKIDAQLRDFWRANQPTHDENSLNPSHHWFHYADVPVQRVEKYKDGEKGRSKFDVVHMIAYCVDVLQGRIPEENDRKITKPIAVILLTHYVGDIHQPLHVGAEYFDKDGNIDDPDKDKDAVADEGGNTLDLRIAGDPPSGHLNHTKKLHGFWDTDTVNALLPAVPEGANKAEKYAITDPAKDKLAHDMATQEPQNWKLPPGTQPRDAGEVWANEILPIAKEAHDRLEFKGVRPMPQEDRVVAVGEADEKPGAKESYKDWSAEVVREEIHKAGWRLADLLTRAVQPGSGSAAAAAPEPTTQTAASASPAPAPSKDEKTESPAVEAVPVPVQTPSANPTATPIYGDYPANYKEIVTTWITSNAPQAAHIEWQTEPKPSDLPTRKGRHVYGYLVIFNSRATPAQTAKTHAALIRDGKVVNMSGFDQ